MNYFLKLVKKFYKSNLDKQVTNKLKNRSVFLGISQDILLYFDKSISA